VVVVLEVVTVVVDVVVVHAVQALPDPAVVPPAVAQLASSVAIRLVIAVQSVDSVHGVTPSWQSPAVQVPAEAKQQTTAPVLPHVERAAQRVSGRNTSAVRQPALRRAFR